MNLGMVIPLKSKRVSRDWQITCEALRKTLCSVLNQTLDKYTVMVCGHEKPEFLSESKFSQIEFLSVNFPPPTPSEKDFTQKDYEIDKNLKIVWALKALIGRNIQYWYQLDSDDLIRRDLVASLQDLTNESGVLLEGGYTYRPKQNRLIPTDTMSIYCGSTAILATDLLNLPDDVTRESMRLCPFARIPHMDMLQYYQSIPDRNVRIVTEHMIVYMLGSGDNISDEYRGSIYKKIKFWMKPYLVGKKPDSQFTSDFAFMD